MNDKLKISLSKSFRGVSVFLLVISLVDFLAPLSYWPFLYLFLSITEFILCTMYLKNKKDLFFWLSLIIGIPSTVFFLIVFLGAFGIVFF